LAGGDVISILNAKAVKVGRTIKEINPGYKSKKYFDCGEIVKKICRSVFIIVRADCQPQGIGTPR